MQLGTQFRLVVTSCAGQFTLSASSVAAESRTRPGHREQTEGGDPGEPRAPGDRVLACFPARPYLSRFLYEVPKIF